MAAGSRRVGFLWGIAALVLLPAGTAWAQVPGRVFLADGPAVSGNITAVSRDGVEIEDQKGEVQKLSIDRVRDVAFSDEPRPLQAARQLIAKGQPGQALAELGKVQPAELDGVDQLILDEMDYVKAAALGGKAVLTGNDLPVAEKSLRDYLAKHGQSHHALAMQELFGNVLARAGKFADAEAAFAVIAKGPPAYRIRAASARANLFFAQKKYDEAIKEFTAATRIASDPKDAAGARQKREAELGVARCLSQQGKAAEALAVVDGILKAADPEEKELLGRAYNALGDAYRAAGKDQDALIAYLTVDLVYNAVRESRAEALYNLADLWARGKYPERGREARQELETNYPDSPWTKKVASAAASP